MLAYFFHCDLTSFRRAIYASYKASKFSEIEFIESGFVSFLYSISFKVTAISEDIFFSSVRMPISIIVFEFWESDCESGF